MSEPSHSQETYSIEVSGLTKAFGKKTALDGLSFSVPGGAFGLLGRNGAGKTTCIRVIMGIFTPDSGSVRFSHDVSVGYLPEERGLYSERRVLDQMRYIGQLRGLPDEVARRRATALLEELDASQYKMMKLGQLSKGNQQKIQLAVTLLHEPDIIILDEPFSGLDPINSKLLKDLINKQARAGRTVIFSSHQMSQIEEFCEEIAIIKEGKCVLSGNLREIKKGYPALGVYVETDGPLEDAESALGSAGLKTARKGGGLVVTLSEPDRKDFVLRALQDGGVPISVFSVLRPSLEDIFVERA
ncbi:MAG: ATP-binding cassette domain-containing protein [Clostridiales bacterium]|jgi:ABC-2 type transport system ATP-binding protein|nr:ATP-binding cassette domain-containing protein [Clostridiales bacterium]